MFERMRDGSASKPRIAIIGCGIFGAMIALRLAEGGAEVHVFERTQNALSGASYNNQNRLHLGFHYPRDDETARQCLTGFQRFRDEFSACIKNNFPNAYFIADKGSLTLPADYITFCDRIGLQYKIIDLKAFCPNVLNVALGVTTDETVYDCAILRTLVMERLDSKGVTHHFGANVSCIKREESGYKLKICDGQRYLFEAVVNCTYANINLLNSQLGFVAPTYQYEYTMVPIIKWDQASVGITVMDGRYMTVLPFGKTGNFLLYHVEHSVVATKVCMKIPEGWLDPLSSPSRLVNADNLFQKIKNSCLHYIPELQGARLVGFLQGPRIVLARHDRTDSRPSIINHHEAGYISVFTGKVDHCMWVADEIARTLLT